MTAAQAVQRSPESLSGWGRTARTVATVCRPESPADIAEILHAAPAGIIARGLGRSYGDAAQSSGGTTVDVSGLNEIIEFDEVDGSVRVAAGVSLHNLMRRIIPKGWFVPVSPGTRQVSVGGAIAADIHGKNHHRDGSFVRHVHRMRLATPSGPIELTPQSDPELFWSTGGGMGLTGVITDATLRLTPIESSWMLVESRRFRSLDTLMTEMEASDHRFRYSVAWLDCSGGRRDRCHSVLTRGDHAPAAALPPKSRERPCAAPEGSRIAIARQAPSLLVNPLSVRAFNLAWYQGARDASDSLRTLSSFFHPLDGVERWNLLYGRKGFVQYQFAVPDRRADVVPRIVDAIAGSRLPSFLAVLKRFGPGTPGYLSFPLEGWTLALDFPLGSPRLSAFLDDLDAQVAEAGGRIYLAKDARLRPELVSEMYPQLGAFQSVCRRVDPEGILGSDLTRRLSLKR